MSNSQILIQYTIYFQHLHFLQLIWNGKFSKMELVV